MLHLPANWSAAIGDRLFAGYLTVPASFVREWLKYKHKGKG